MSWDKWHRDPREGEWPEPTDNCPHGIDRREATCGRCAWRDEPRDVTEDVRALALVAMLERLQHAGMTEDEQMGAWYAARFGGQ